MLPDVVPTAVSRDPIISAIGNLPSAFSNGSEAVQVVPPDVVPTAVSRDQCTTWSHPYLVVKAIGVCPPRWRLLSVVTSAKALRLVVHYIVRAPDGHRPICRGDLLIQPIGLTIQGITPGMTPIPWLYLALGR
jgi:hypothetical protein